MSDLAEYLGAKYGGWYDLAKLYGHKWQTDTWIALPMGGGTGPTVYRLSWVKEAGYDTIPDDLPGFFELCRKLKQNGHPSGFSIGHAVGDANGFCDWALWSHNGAVVDEHGKVMLDSKPTIDALKYVAELYKEDDSRHDCLERFRQQQGLCGRRYRPDLQRRVDLLRAEELPRSEAQGDGGRHQSSGRAQGTFEAGANERGRHERDAVSAQPVSQCRQGVSAFHDGGAAIRPVAREQSGLLVAAAEVPMRR